MPQPKPIVATYIKKYPVGAFIVLTFLITHIANPLIVEGIRVLFPDFGFTFPLSQLNHRSLIAEYGGTMAAIIVVISLYGLIGFKSTLTYSRLNFPWLAISVVLPLVMIILSYWLAGASLMWIIDVLFSNWKLYLLIIGGFVLSAGLAEEYGWRGFLLPQLLKSRSPLASTFILCLILSLWHFPALLSGWKNEPLSLAYIVGKYCGCAIMALF